VLGVVAEETESRAIAILPDDVAAQIEDKSIAARL